jgi:hypothetical protein
MAKSSGQHVSLAGANRRIGKSANPQSKISSVSFEPANGGLISKSHGEDGVPGYSAPNATIHPSMSHAIQHLKSTLGHVFNKEGGTE